MKKYILHLGDGKTRSWPKLPAFQSHSTWTTDLTNAILTPQTTDFN